MIYSKEVENMCSVCKGAYHGPAPIPEEGKWVAVKEIKEISGYTHGIGWCAPQQGAQTEPQREGRYHSGGSRRDNRLHGYDTLCRYGV